jgi:hypothetical protein
MCCHHIASLCSLTGRSVQQLIKEWKAGDKMGQMPLPFAACTKTLWPNCLTSSVTEPNSGLGMILNSHVNAVLRQSTMELYLHSPHMLSQCGTDLIKNRDVTFAFSYYSRIISSTFYRSVVQCTDHALCMIY